MYLLEQTPETAYERKDGTVTWRCGDIPLHFTILKRPPMWTKGEIVTNKHLGQALAHIQEMKIERDRDLLASKRLTNREKRRLRDHRTARFVAWRYGCPNKCTFDCAPGNSPYSVTLAVGTTGQGPLPGNPR